MPTLKPTEQDEKLAERVNDRLPEWVPRISKATTARWRAGHWPKGRPKEAGLLPRKRQEFGGPVLYTEEAEPTAACLATVMQEMRNEHLRPRLDEAVLICFFRGHEFKIDGLRWAYRTALERLRVQLEGSAGPEDVQAMARAAGRDMSRRAGPQGVRMRRRLKVAGAPVLPVVMVGVMRAFLGAGPVRPEHQLAFGWPDMLDDDDQAFASKISLDGMANLFDQNSDECVSAEELLQGRADVLALLAAEPRMAELMRQLLPGLTGDIDPELLGDHSELEKAMAVPGIVALRRHLAESSDGLGFDTLINALGSVAITNDPPELPP